jgi:hypothetical protein
MTRDSSGIDNEGTETMGDGRQIQHNLRNTMAAATSGKPYFYNLGKVAITYVC